MLDVDIALASEREFDDAVLSLLLDEDGAIDAFDVKRDVDVAFGIAAFVVEASLLVIGEDGDGGGELGEEFEFAVEQVGCEAYFLLPLMAGDVLRKKRNVDSPRNDVGDNVEEVGVLASVVEKSRVGHHARQDALEEIERRKLEHAHVVDKSVHHLGGGGEFGSREKEVELVGLWELVVVNEQFGSGGLLDEETKSDDAIGFRTRVEACEFVEVADEDEVSIGDDT